MHPVGPPPGRLPIWGLASAGGSCQNKNVPHVARVGARPLRGLGRWSEVGSRPANPFRGDRFPFGMCGGPSVYPLYWRWQQHSTRRERGGGAGVGSGPCESGCAPPAGTLCILLAPSGRCRADFVAPPGKAKSGLNQVQTSFASAACDQGSAFDAPIRAHSRATDCETDKYADANVQLCL